MVTLCGFLKGVPAIHKFSFYTNYCAKFTLRILQGWRLLPDSLPAIGVKHARNAVYPAFWVCYHAPALK
jgi:hypothetical protein